MGLDMFLERMPRYKETTPNQVNLISEYFDWSSRKKNGSTSCTFKEWCGFEGNKIAPVDVIEFYKPFYKVDKYGFGNIAEEVGYWRKQNAIHCWFVDHVQDGIDDCGYHHEVTKEILEELLDTCETVLASSELVEGKIQDGFKYEDGKRVPIMEDGKYIKNPLAAEELLPTSSGFFFGSTDYDEYYLDGIKHTIDIITKVLETTDFDKEMVYYVSSW